MLQHAALSNEMFQDVLPEWKGFSSPMACEVHRHNFVRFCPLSVLYESLSFEGCLNSIGHLVFICFDVKCLSEIFAHMLNKR